MDTHLFGPDDRIGEYKVLRQVGLGGMSEVYSVEDSDGIKSTLKLCLPHSLLKDRGVGKTAYELSKVQSAEERAVNEAKMLNSINHAHIVKVQRLLRDLPLRGATGLLLERIDGVRTLDELMSDVPQELYLSYPWDVASFQTSRGFDPEGRLRTFLQKYGPLITLKDPDYVLGGMGEALADGLVPGVEDLYARVARGAESCPLPFPDLLPQDESLSDALKRFQIQGWESVLKDLYDPEFDFTRESGKSLPGRPSVGRYVSDAKLMTALQARDAAQILNLYLREFKRRYFGVLPQIEEGLSYLNSDGLLHRDLYGGNVLIDRTFRVKIIDFGAAAPLGNVDRWASRRARPPEVYWGREDKNSDWWAFAALSYQVFAGKHPLCDDTSSPAIEEETRIASELLSHAEEHPGTLGLRFDRLSCDSTIPVDIAFGREPLCIVFDHYLPPSQWLHRRGGKDEDGFRFLDPAAYHRTSAFLDKLSLFPERRIPTHRYKQTYNGGLLIGNTIVGAITARPHHDRTYAYQCALVLRGEPRL